MSRQTGVRFALVAAAAWLIYLLRSIMVPLFAAYLLMLLWLPLHLKMKRKLGNGVSAFCCTMLTLIAPLFLILPAGPELGQLGTYLSGADLTALQSWVEATLTSLSERLPDGWMEDLKGFGLTPEQAAARAQDAANIILGTGRWLLGVFGGILGIVSILVLLPIFLFYLLSGGPWLPKLRKELPPPAHARYDRVMPRIQEILVSFLRTRFLVGVVKGVIGFVVLFAFGFPGAYTLALLLGLFSILPVIGPFVAFLAVATVGLIDGGRTGGGLAGVITAASLSIFLELLEGYVLLPRMVGPGVGLSDFAVVLAMLFGAALGGILGVLVAVPVVAVIRVLYIEFVRPVVKLPAPAAKT